MPHDRFIYPNDSSFRIHSRGRLPHWEVDHGLYFLTWRLRDSIPREGVDRLREIREEFRRSYGESLNDAQRLEIERALFRESELWLDRGLGGCELRNPKAAEIVREALHFRDEERHRILTWSIMPNHVHAIATIYKGEDLSRLLHSWKSFTSHEINRALGRKGNLWEKEYFDRLIRSEKELRRTIRYVLNNPSKAGLVDWPWIWLRDGY